MNIKNFKNKKNLIRLIAFIIFLAVIVTATILFIPMIRSLLTEEGRNQLQADVQSYGPWAWLIFLGLQVLQVVVAIIPGEPIEIIAGILFGTFKGMGLCLLGLLIGTIAVYYLVKLVGNPLVHAFVPEEKIQNMKIFKNSQRLEALIFLLFLIPGTPKDTLTYFVPLTKIKPWKFFILSTIARIPSILSSTLAGENIGKGQWAWTAVIFICTALIGLVGIYYNDKIMKDIKEKHSKK